MDEPDIGAVRRRVEEELRKRPGVVGVGFGFKERDGEVTDQLSFRVYVREKKPEESLAPGEAIPAEIEGFPTDVIVVSTVHKRTEDLSMHDPLIGGITIATRSGDAFHSGTLGFFATVNGLAGPKNVVLVTNNHVIADHHEAVGDTVYQPRLLPAPGGGYGVDSTPEGVNPVATIHNLGLEATHPFAYASEPQEPYYIDAATALLDISISSWCNTNCGVSYKNEVRELALGTGAQWATNPSSKIKDIRRLSDQDILAAGSAGVTVFKCGRTTGRGRGKVTDANGMNPNGGRAIIIHPVDTTAFLANGDSGASLVDEQRQLIGICYGSPNSDLNKGLASHIHPVLDFLHITAITEANPPVGPAGQARSDVLAAFAPDGGAAIPLRERFRATRRGGQLYAEMMRHRDEVVRLVNTCRAVTVAWHRGKGPAYMNRIVANARDSGERLPREIESVTRAALLQRMSEALRAHGSADLRDTIEAHEDELSRLFLGHDDLRSMAASLERDEAATKEEALCGAS